jgi:hypothetical protein
MSIRGRPRSIAAWWKALWTQNRRRTSRLQALWCWCHCQSEFKMEIPANLLSVQASSASPVRGANRGKIRDKPRARPITNAIHLKLATCGAYPRRAVISQAPSNTTARHDRISARRYFAARGSAGLFADSAKAAAAAFSTRVPLNGDDSSTGSSS